MSKLDYIMELANYDVEKREEDEAVHIDYSDDGYCIGIDWEKEGDFRSSSFSWTKKLRNSHLYGGNFWKL